MKSSVSTTTGGEATKRIRTNWTKCGRCGRFVYHGELTAREVQIATLIAKDFTNKQIANSLRISTQTVKNFVTNMLHKLEVESRVGIAVWLARNMPECLEELKEEEAVAIQSTRENSAKTEEKANIANAPYLIVETSSLEYGPSAQLRRVF